MALSTLFWSLGVILFCALINEFCADERLALLSAAFIGLDPGNALEFGCNIHRAADFASANLFILASLAVQRKPSFLPSVSLLIASFLAMGADYIQFLFLTCFSFLLMFSLSLARTFEGRLSPELARDFPHTQGRGAKWRAVKLLLAPALILAFVTCFAFVLRQIQVIAGAGYMAWTHDFLYQILNRTHNEALYHGDWLSLIHI